MTTTAALSFEGTAGRHQAIDVEIVVPVYNEESDLAASILRLHHYLSTQFPLTWMVTIADNASRDQTWGIACGLASQLEGVRTIHLEKKGRGRALRAAWSASRAAVVAYMDVDLSTDLDALLPLVAPLLSGHSDMAIGSRLAVGARVIRGPKREVVSRTYNLILKATLHNRFSDAQCGFKAVRADVARALLPLVEDNAWFFDTELLILAEHNGLRIHEVPVDWVDDPDSRVQLTSTAIDDLRGIWRMLRRFAAGEGALPAGSLGPEPLEPGLAGQVIRFAGIGVVSTVMFAVLFVLLAGPVGPLGADAIALGVCGAAGVAANRRVTFARRGRPGRRRHYSAGLAVAFLPLGLTVAALLILGWTGVDSVAADLAALTAVNTGATSIRFEVLRRWVFRPVVEDPPLE
jgi:putative flippase GtrA